MDPSALENRVLGHCKLVRQLGQGGMGAVWLARHQTLDKDVAVKILPTSYADDPEAVARFLREARSAARLEHPNVVQVLDAGSQDGVHFIVMQLVDGTDLEKLLRKKGRFEVDDALAVGKRVALALGAAHDLGIVHRDIKPANLMIIAKTGRVMVTDFGLARDIKGNASITHAEEAMGTPHYIAPEQARGEAVDGRTDLYSLGGTLYALLTGKPPYSGKTPVAIVTKHVSPDERPRSLRELQPGIPADVDALVLKLLEKKPENRYANAADLVAAIDQIKGIGKKSTLRLRLIAGGIAAVVILLFFLILRPSAAERDFRKAEAARTDDEKLSIYAEVVSKHPDTTWAQQATLLSNGIRRAMLDRELSAIKLAGLEGKTPMADLLARLDQLRPKYPKDLKAIDGLEFLLMKNRAIGRTKDFAEALRTHKPEDRGERFKEFISPEVFKKTGEGWVMFAVRLVLGGMTGVGVRVEEVEIAQDRITLEKRNEAVVPVKAVSHNTKSRERTTHKLTIHWVWQEGDWYLAEKGIQEEK